MAAACLRPLIAASSIVANTAKVNRLTIWPPSSLARPGPPGALLEHMVVRLSDPAVKVVAAGRTTQARCQARDGGHVSTTAAEPRVSLLLRPALPYGSPGRASWPTESPGAASSRIRAPGQAPAPGARTRGNRRHPCRTRF